MTMCNFMLVEFSSPPPRC